MGWISDVFGRKDPTPQTPPGAAKPPATPATPPPAMPTDQVTISKGGPAQGPGPLTPAGLPGAPDAKPAPTPAEEAAAKALAAEQETQLRERLQLIESVGRGLSGDYRLGLEAGDAWTYDFGTNTIVYKRDDLIGKDGDYAIGVILQETGRRVYSRTPSDPLFKDNPALSFLNDAVEGCRVNNLQTSKFAGAKQFFQKVYDEDLLKKTEDSIRVELEEQLVKKAGITPEEARKAVMKMKSPVPRHMQFALGLIHDWYTEGNGEDPDWMRDKNAIRALDATRNDFREAFKLQREIFQKDLSPKEVIEQAKKSEEIVTTKLWPVYKKLLEMDQKDLGQSLFGNQGGQQGQQGQQSGKGQQGQQGQQAGKGQQGQQSGKGQQSGQGQGSGKAGEGKEGQGQGQGQGSGKAGEGKESQGQGQGQGSGKAGEGKESQGGGGGQGTEESKEQKEGEGAGGGKGTEESKENKEGKGAGGGKPSDKAGEAGKGGGGDAGVPDPKDMDTSDGGSLDDSNLSKEQRDKVREIFDELDKQLDRKVQSREERDKADGASGAGKEGGSGESQGANPGQGGGNGRGTSQIDLPTLQKLLEQKAETERTVENLKTPYDKYYAMLAPDTDELAGQLKNVLNENAEPKYIGDFNSGPKLNMRRAMQSSAKYERTGQFDEDMWLRRSDPSKRDYDFVFVVDESGSMMDGTKWDNLLKGLIMSAEALQQLKIGFSVVGFSDQPMLHKVFEDKYDETFREQMLSQIQRANHGGTNDSDALKEALELMKGRSSDNQKFIIVLTDGQGKEQELREQIAQARRMGIDVIGIGIGEGMSYVKQVYPEALAVDSVKNLPYELSDLIRTKILEAMEERH